MKRQSHQNTLEAYYGKRSRFAAVDEGQSDDVVVVSTGMTALQMIADAYADDEGEEQQEEVQEVVYADPADIAHDHDYFTTEDRAEDIARDEYTIANPEHVEHDHSYTASA